MEYIFIAALIVVAMPFVVPAIINAIRNRGKDS